MVPLRTMSDVSGNRKSKMAVTSTGSTYISACRPYSNKIPKTNTMFFGSGISMVPLQTMSDVSGNRKSKMAVTSTGSTYISACRPYSNEIPKANTMFFGSGIPMVPLQTMSDVSGNRKSKMAVTSTGSTYISACRPYSNKIPKANTMFFGSGIPMVPLRTMSDVSGNRKSKMAVTSTGSTYISACRPDSNEIPNGKLVILCSLGRAFVWCHCRQCPK